MNSPPTSLSPPFPDGESLDPVEALRREVDRLTRENAALRDRLTVATAGDGSDRTAARRRVEDELREANRRKDEFLATLAHELRNPLAPIRNSLHILRIAGATGDTVDRVHEMLERQINHLVRLVDDLLEVSRVSRGKVDLRAEPVEVAAVVRTAIETSKPHVDAAGHQLAISIPSEPLTLTADPVRLAQVVSNLLNNAAKYTPEGGQIWLSVRRDGHEVVLSVKDTGVGIPPEMLPTVFDMFTQIDRTLGRAQGGLGIGLSLVRSLVEAHGGRVEALSGGPGKGSEFVVRLPLATDTFRTALPEPSPLRAETSVV